MSAASLEQVRTAGLRIGGEERPASDGATYPVANPATGTIVAHVADAGAADVALAVPTTVRVEAGWARTATPSPCATSTSRAVLADDAQRVHLQAGN